MFDRLTELICEELDIEKEIGKETVIGELVDDEIEMQELFEAVENEFGIQLDCNPDITIGELSDLLEV